VKDLRAELDALELRLAAGRPAASDNATRSLEHGASPIDTFRDQSAPDTFDRLGINTATGRVLANPSIAMHSESHRAAHAKAPLGLIVAGAIVVLAVGAAAIAFFSAEKPAAVAPAPAPAPAAAVAPPASAPPAPLPPAVAVVPAGSGSGSGSGAAPVAAPSAVPEAAAPAAKPEAGKAAAKETTPAPKRVAGPKPVKKTSPAKPGEPVDPYAE
jgi:hypothetical protein